MRKLTVQFFGALREKFGAEFTLVAETPARALHGLQAMIPELRSYFAENSEPGFHIICGKDLGEEDLGGLAVDDVVQVIPVVVGASSGLRIVLGAVLVVVGYALSFTPYAAASPFLINMGLGMMVGGIAEILMKKPVFNNSSLDKGPSDTPSYSFQGPHMATGQGNCVPIGYGRLRVGGNLVSVAISPETWPTKGFGGAATDELGTTSGDGDTTPWVWAVAPVQG